MILLLTAAKLHRHIPITATMLASEARLLLGFPDTPTQNARYLVWRSDLTEYMGQNGITSQSQAGVKKWDAFKMYAISHQYARGYKGSYLKG